MSFFFGTKVVLFSPMQGILSYQGQPAANAKIVRHLIWKDSVGEKENFYSDEHGRFDLPIKRKRVRLPLLAEFVITQEILVCYESKEFTIWARSKWNIEEYGEMGGKIVNLRCELTNEIRFIDPYRQHRTVD